MSSEMPVLYTVAHNIAHVVMNRPGAMNAMSRGLITDLRQALERAQGDPGVSLVVLSGAGGNFCAGDDLKETEHQTAEDFLALILDLQRLTRLLLLGEKPSIAALGGYAVGGGFELALACDLLEAAAQAGVRPFVYTSTTSLYGRAMVSHRQAVWVTEALVPRPRDIYDRTKITAEQLCRRFALSMGLPTICPRHNFDEYLQEACQAQLCHTHPMSFVSYPGRSE